MQANHNLRKGSLMDTTVEKAVAEYLASLKQEGKSDETVLWHVKKSTYLKTFLAEQHCERVSDLMISHGRDFIRSLQERETLYPEHPLRQTVSR
jgi:hypothetical protein